VFNFLGSGRARVEVYRVGSDSGSNLSVGSGAGTKSSIRAGVYLKDILKLVCVYNLIYCDCYILSECSKSISCPFA